MLELTDNASPIDGFDNVGTRERRIASRRGDDFFWLDRLGSITGDGSLVVNAAGTIVYHDERVESLLELSEGLLALSDDFATLVMHMAELGYFGLGDPRAFAALFKDMLTNQRMKQKTGSQEIRATTPSGRRIVLDITYGRDDRYIMLVRDRTDAYLEEQALSTALKIGESGYWFFNLKNDDFRIRGGAILDHIGLDVNGDMSRGILSEHLHKDDRPTAYTNIKQCIETKKPVTMVCRIMERPKPGQSKRDVFYVKSHMMPNVDEANEVRSIICFFHDITSQLRVQDELRSAQARAESALKTKNNFLGRLSHEVRTPMNAVIGMADALIHHHNDPEINPKLILMQDSAEKIVRLVDETLQHTKLEEEHVELNARSASPSDLIRNVCAMWEEQAAKVNTRLICKIDPTVPEQILFDDFRYEQCVNNLLSNAVKFTEGGVVQVVLTTQGGDRHRRLVLAVKDSGIGMNAVQQQRVFLPYQQGDKSISGRFGGTGLGLSITKDLIELMDGRIDLRSQPGEGSVFVLSIPILTADDDAVGSDMLVGEMIQADAEQAPSDYSDLRVLIVDDNATNHMVIGSLLGSLVGHVETAMNGEEAIQKLELGQYDLVLMDIHMPVMDGIEATLAIRSTDAPYVDVPIIALTADPQYQQSRLCKNIGMDEALAKPVKLSGLLKAFDTVLGRKVTSLAA